ncbi:hypothetical protein RB195_009759 [Necator americanus]|uniref:Uncharacterized protein n=1 Tax=Necator americanus TaxID=51031 RepID=A0ABR1CUT5_NECAM
MNQTTAVRVLKSIGKVCSSAPCVSALEREERKAPEMRSEFPILTFTGVPNGLTKLHPASCRFDPTIESASTHHLKDKRKENSRMTSTISRNACFFFVHTSFFLNRTRIAVAGKERSRRSDLHF